MNNAQAINGEVNTNRRDQLIERLDRNMTDFKGALLDFDKQELIDMSATITAAQDAYMYMKILHIFSVEELQFYLQFQNPLEIISDAWLKNNTSLKELRLTMEATYEQKDGLSFKYPLMSDIDAFADAPVYHRYMGVDLTDFLGKIAKEVIVHNPEDWDSNKEGLKRIALSRNPDDKRLMWQVSSRGTNLFTERDTFIKETAAFNTWVNNRTHDTNVSGYVVQITGCDGSKVWGNVFEIGNYADHAQYVRETALPLDSVTLTYKRTAFLRATQRQGTLSL